MKVATSVLLCCLTLAAANVEVEKVSSFVPYLKFP
jgi:hypothetical protein